jgi:hypothetical protein
MHYAENYNSENIWPIMIVAKPIGLKYIFLSKTMYIAEKYTKNYVG